VLTLEGEFATGRELFTGFGERGILAEQVAQRVLDEARRWEALDVPVGEHLADQLLIPLALAGGGDFRTTAPTMHTRTNAAIVERLLGVPIAIESEHEGRWRLTAGPSGR
jgi:RNA 3'-terminal phosphate cyclase (ATP)